MGGGQSFFVTMLMTTVILFVVFLILREFFCWYWKINQIVSLLSDINNKLSVSNNKPSNTGNKAVDNFINNSSSTTNNTPLDADSWTCICGKPNKGGTCPNCGRVAGAKY